MGVGLLVVEHLIVVVLFIATVIAWRMRRPSNWRRAASIVAIALPIIVYGVLWLASTVYRQKQLLYPGHVAALGALWGAIFIALVALLWAAHRRNANGEYAGSTWLPGRLATLTLVAIALHAITFWNLDVAARQRLAALRVEAGAMALGLAPSRPPDRENAALVYEQAFARLPKYNEWPKEWQDWTDEKLPLDPHNEKLSAFLDQHRETAAHIRRAAHMPACYFEHDYAKVSLAMLLPEFGSLRDAANLVAVDSRRAAIDGRTAEALAGAQALLRMAEQTGGNPLLIGVLVSYAIDGRAIDVLQAALDGRQPTTEELRSVEIDDVYSPRRMLYRGFEMEEAFGLGGFYEAGMDRHLWGLLGIADSFIFTPSSVYRVLLVDDDVAVYRELMHSYQALADLPLAEAYEKAQEFDGQFEQRPHGAIAHQLVPALVNIFQTTMRVEARHNAARTALAVHRYRADTGELPDSLSALVPKYLPQVFVDPFDGQPLRWKVDGERWVVYSIGPDGKDEGGAVFDAVAKTGDVAFYSHAPERETSEAPVFDVK